MKRRFALVTVGLLVALGACGGNSDEDCDAVCSWWAQYCTGESQESCVSDCKDSDESAKDAIDRCVNGAGWGTPSDCKSASCCVRFVHDNYNDQCL